jgi:hypothetical protein
MKQYIIFRCEKDDCWVVSVMMQNHIAKGVAECSDEHTARVVMDALQQREEARYGPAKSQASV